MNKIYSVVWSRSLNQLVVASELAALGGKASGGKKAQYPAGTLSAAIMASLLAMGGMGWAGSVQAQNANCTVAPWNAYNGTAACMGAGATAVGQGATALGSEATVTTGGGVAVGFDANSLGLNAIAVGFQAHSSATNSIYLGARTAVGTGALADGAIGIGTDVRASGGNTVAIGTQSRAVGNQSIAFGLGALAGNTGNSAVPNSISIGVNSRSTANSTVALGTAANASADGGAAVGNTAAASGINATALGSQTTAGATNATAVGAAAEATGVGASALGSFANASGGNSAAIGSGANASGADAFAGGRSAAATNAAATAVGNSARAQGNSSLALGAQALAIGTSTVAVGQGAGAGSTTTNTGSVAMGVAAGTLVSGAQNTAIGGGVASAMRGAGSGVTGTRNVAFGTGDGTVAYDATLSASAGSLVSGSDNIAIGTNAGIGVASNATTSIGLNANASAGNAVAIGSGANASALDAVAQGSSASAGGRNAIAIGFQSIASHINSINLGARTLAGSGATAAGAIAIGTDVTASQDRAVAMGIVSRATGEDALAIGTRANAAANYATALGAGGTNAANAVRATGIGSLALGGNATAGAVASGANAIAIGGEAVADADEAVAIGRGSTATGGKAVAIGSGNFASGNGAVAIGDPNTASGDGAVAQGMDNTATGNGSVAMGNTNMVGGGGQAVSTPGIAAQGAVGIGYQNTVIGQGSVAIGSTSSALAAGAVAFGDTAVANNAGDVALGSGSVTDVAVATPSAVIDGVNYNFAGTTPTSTVSVGAIGAERTITNVAAGRISGTSTDAINGSQLFATNQAIEAVATTANAGWDISAQGANATNVAPGEAVDLNNSDGNIVVSKSAADDNVTFDLADDITVDSVTAGNTVLNSNGLTITGGPSVTTAGINAGGLVMSNVAPGVAGTDAVNVNQLTAVSNIANAGWNITDGTTTGNIGPNETLTMAAGSNATVVYDDTTGTMIVGVVADPSFNSVTVGDTLITDGSISFTSGGPSITNTGINAGGLVISNVAPGVAGTDAVNVNQLTAVSDAANAGWNITDGTTTGNIGPNETLTMAAGSNATVVYDDTTGTMTFAVVADPSFSSVTVGDTLITDGSISFTSGGPSITNTGINAGGATITNVGSAVNGTDAVNLNQVTNLVDGVATHYYSVNDNGVVGGNYNNDGATGINALAAGVGAAAGGASSVAIGLGATAADANSVALGSNALTAAAVGTPSIAIGTTTYNFAGTAPVGTVSVGSVGAERTITNVAAGRISGTSTDAINGSQLFATNQSIENLSNVVDATATHYYSVNDNGVVGGNYNNDGASGINALAAGVGASSVGSQSVAVGNNANAQALQGVAIGSNTIVTTDGAVALGTGSVSDRVVAPQTGGIIAGTGLVPYNTTDKTLLGAVSIGSATSYRQITNVADGTEDQDAVTLRQLKGALSSFAVTPTMYFHANSTAADSLAAGADSVAIGPRTTVNGDNGIGMGNGAIVQMTAPGGIAIGQNSTVSFADGLALGTNSTANGIQSIALGAGATAGQPGSVALGAGSTTATAVVTTGTTINGVNYTFAGTNPTSTVSVGTVGGERTITNVAAGRISASSTDAVNGSQLHATNQAVAQVDARVTNIESSITNISNGSSGMFQVSPDSTVAPTPTGTNSAAGGSGAVASGNNSTAVGNGSTASGTDSSAFGNGASATGNNSVAIGTGSVASADNTVSVGAEGGERRVTNVAAGVNDTDAVNVSQLRNVTSGGVQYDQNGDGTTNYNSVTLNSGGGPTVIRNVAAGVSDTDAVNVSQLQSGLSHAINQANSYTDARMNQMQDDMWTINRGYRGATASAMAMAGLPQVYLPGKSMLAVGFGGYQSEYGMAIGLSGITDNGRWVYKAQASGNTTRDWGFSLGAGIQW